MMLFTLAIQALVVVGAFVTMAMAQYYAAPISSSPYTLSHTYDQSNFFTEFDFFTGEDPTHGFVQYVDGNTAKANGLAGVDDGAVFMGVDAKTKNPPSGRQSVRLTSRQGFTHGLFVADIAHMPGPACGVWPAFWMFGPKWPYQGEIDIIEGVSNQVSNQITLHTSPGCSIDNNGTAGSTTLINGDCNAFVRSNEGCGQGVNDASSYGAGFNAAGGGVYATEWTSTHISVWFFSRGNIPSDISSGRPKPSSWGRPSARFNGGQGCDLDAHFVSNNLVFDTTFCGDWAGSAWGRDATCSGLAATCEDYVAAAPEAFGNSFWLVNSIKVYNAAGGYARRRHGRHGSWRA